MACKYKYNNAWYSKEELKSILLKERGILPDGKLKKPEIKRGEFKTGFEVLNWNSADAFGMETIKFNTKKEAENYIYKKAIDLNINESDFENILDRLNYEIKEVQISIGKQPKITRKNTTSIESVKNEVLNLFTTENNLDFVGGHISGKNAIEGEEFSIDNHLFKLIYDITTKNFNLLHKFKGANLWNKISKTDYKNYNGTDELIKEQKNILEVKINNFEKKEYTSQALTNLKVAALKEVARKYPRSLITSKVVPINPNMVDNSEIQYSKVSSKSNNIKPGVEKVFNENPELASISTPEQYSQYLDTILPDSKVEEIDNSLYISVLNQLEQENIIEKDCTGGGKLKAEKGLQTNFNRGGKWKLIRDLKGYPTHKEGGVDLIISKNGVSIRNGNTEFTAKHGLVIPKN